MSAGHYGDITCWTFQQNGGPSAAHLVSQGRSALGPGALGRGRQRVDFGLSCFIFHFVRDPIMVFMVDTALRPMENRGLAMHDDGY
jgi:hypothetical protein